MEAGRPRPDRPEVAIETVRAAVAEGARQAGSAPLFAGGHSFGGRMTTLAASGGQLPVHGLVLCSFPLHLPGKPDVARAASLARIAQPLLFLSGDRDAMAERERLAGVVSGLGPRAQLHWLETADHGYRVLKRTRRSAESVFDEIARVARAFIDRTAGDPSAPPGRS
jgi:predicted alpha/beta-hydrolase family hydrolase